ncbi:MAG: hypothetical protein DMF96_12955 [Acidobacteria bacterium]|nr:MAG: hypothetical protein DMF96_12955 [Acidobacteriota bacterium]
MADGQPRPAFYVAVLLVVISLVGLALWRYGAIGPGGLGQAGRFSTEELKQMKSGAEAPDSSGITTVKEYKYVATAKLPAVKGISSYKPMADRTVRFAINVWAGWSPIIFANNGFKPGKVWKAPGGKDFKIELVLIDDPVAMRDAYAAGNLHVGWATLDMLPLFLEGLRKDTRVMPRVYQQVDWSNGGLRAERADQRRRPARRSRVQVHAGRLPGGGRVQRRQAPRGGGELGARHLQPREGEGQPRPRHDVDGQ